MIWCSMPTAHKKSKRTVKKSPDEILKTLETNREQLRKLGVRSLGLFGSAVRGKATPASDLDFLVELKNETFDAYMDLKEFLEGLFGCRVDLVLADNIKPRLRPAIMAEVIYAQGL